MSSIIASMCEAPSLVVEISSFSAVSILRHYSLQNSSLKRVETASL